MRTLCRGKFEMVMECHGFLKAQKNTNPAYADAWLAIIPGGGEGILHGNVDGCVQRSSLNPSSDLFHTWPLKSIPLSAFYTKIEKNLYPFSNQNGSKTVSIGTARAYIAYAKEYLPPHAHATTCNFFCDIIVKAFS